MGVCAVLLAGCSVDVSIGGEPVGDQSVTTDSTTTDWPAVTRLVVDSDAGDVTVGPGPAAQVVATSRYGGAAPQVDQAVESGVLTVTVRCPAGSDPCSTDLAITVPAATTGQVDVGAGEVAVADLTGDQDLESGAGDVRGTGLGAAVVTARTGAGDVELRHAVAPQRVDAQAGAGNVTVTVPAAEVYRVAADSGVGEVTVEVADDPGASRTVIARSGAGDVAVLGG